MFGAASKAHLALFLTLLHELDTPGKAYAFMDPLRQCLETFRHSGREPDAASGRG